MGKHAFAPMVNNKPSYANSIPGAKLGQTGRGRTVPLLPLQGKGGSGLARAGKGGGGGGGGNGPPKGPISLWGAFGPLLAGWRRGHGPKGLCGSFGPPAGEWKRFSARQDGGGQGGETDTKRLHGRSGDKPFSIIHPGDWPRGPTGAEGRARVVGEPADWDRQIYTGQKTKMEGGRRGRKGVNKCIEWFLQRGGERFYKKKNKGGGGHTTRAGQKGHIFVKALKRVLGARHIGSGWSPDWGRLGDMRTSKGEVVRGGLSEGKGQGREF